MTLLQEIRQIRKTITALKRRIAALEADNRRFQEAAERTHTAIATPLHRHRSSHGPAE